jgi:hypothetical protein
MYCNEKGSDFWYITPCSSSKISQLSEEHVASIFDPKDGGDIFLRNVCRLSTDYTALCPWG